MAPGEIWLIDFRWHDGVTIQQRPVLIMRVYGDKAAYVQIRGSEDSYGEQRKRRQEDVDIDDWRGAGLIKPSHVRFEREFLAPVDLFFKKLGQLTPSDMLHMKHRGYRIG